MEGFPRTALILFTAFTICNALSFPRNEFFQEDDEVPRHVLPKIRENKRTLNAENLNDLEKALLRASREKGKENVSKNEGNQEQKREKAAEASWIELLRRQRALQKEREREKEILMKELLSDMNERKNTIRVPAKAWSTNVATKVFAESLPKNFETALRKLDGNHRDREQEIEKIRNDHHGRKERIMIRKQERERKQHKMINNQLVNELEKEMRGHRQRMVNVGGRLREKEQRFRERERSRVGA